MDTKPEGAQSESNTAENDAPSPSAQTPPPERLAEKRRREEEDEDELVKLTAGPKRRSSTSSNAGAGSILRKKSLSGAPADKNAAVLGVAPKRIAINIGSTGKLEPDPCTEVQSNEKENPAEKDETEDNQG
jgi:protein phosphatase-4 regulatory subunit 3